jgi:5-formaminoimidazole-4-carboxamide-1-(beta)-D-ribofuranosyl 5'-monophosphate synthetase
MKNITIATLGSHSALDICRGAKDEGLKNLVICEKGREATYSNYYKTVGKIGCVDECLIVNKFSDILTEDTQKILRKKNVIFIPHRSFEVYLNFDYEAIEKKFNIPMFGNRYMLKIEERGNQLNQYDLLKKADIRYPLQFKNPKNINRLCLVKVLEKERGFERAFFMVENYHDYQNQVEINLKKGVFTKDQLKKSVIEEFILGTQVNFNFFYSPMSGRLELIGTDTRRQTNIEGLLKLPAPYQKKILKKISIKYEEAGHIAVTVLESMLEEAYKLGEKFVKVSKDIFPPGIIGPFALQGFIIPGPPKKEIVVVDISPRIPGSPGIIATPYSSYLFGQSISMGRRIAREVRSALEKNRLHDIIS